MKSLKDIVSADLCLGCGLCNLNFFPAEPKVELKYSQLKGHIVPKNVKLDSQNAKTGFELCPGKGYKINTLANQYNLGSRYNEDLGSFDDIKVVTVTNKSILQKASSSGIMTVLVDYLLGNKLVDKAIVTKFEYTSKGPVALAFSTNKQNEIFDAQGSKYCPVDFSALITELKEKRGNNKYVFVGTPCQIASLRYIQSNIQDLGIKFFIGNFCGGFKSYNNLRQLINLHKIKTSEVNYFRFRGGGQPGSMLIQSDFKTAEIPYPKYVSMTGYLKLKRCHLCVDANAELADFACGDAWLPEYQKTKIPTSIVITRNKAATAILNEISAQKIISAKDISEEKVTESQYGNIKSKKYRQKSRMRLYKILGKKLPEIVEGFREDGNKSLLLELNIFIRHQIKLFFEKIGLYYYLYYKKTFVQKAVLGLFKSGKNK